MIQKKPNKILLLDTATEKTTIGFFDGAKLHAQTFKSSPDNNRKLLVIIEKFLGKYNSKPSSLQAIGLIKGPGGFTGIRIGCTIANSLGYALNIPVYGCDTLTAQIDPDSNGKLLAFLPANKEEAYMIEFLNGKMVGDIKIVSIEDTKNTKAVSSRSRIDNLLKRIISGNIRPAKQVMPLYVKKPNITPKKEIKNI